MDKAILALMVGLFAGLWAGVKLAEEHWHVSRFLALVEEEENNVRARNAAEYGMRGL